MSKAIEQPDGRSHAGQGRLAAGDRSAGTQCDALQAARVENQDIGDDQVLRGIEGDGACDAEAMLAGCAEPAVTMIVSKASEQNYS